MSFKFFFLVFLFLVFSQSVFSYNYIFNDNILQSREYKADLIECSTSYTNCYKKQTDINRNTNKQILLNNLNSVNKNYIVIFKFNDNSVRYSWLEAWRNSEISTTYYSSNSPHNINPKLSYQRGSSYGDVDNHLSNNKCELSNLEFSNNQLSVNSNLRNNAFPYFSIMKNLGYLDNHYYMKTEITAKLHDSNGDFIGESIYPNEKQSNSQYSNFVLVKPNRNVFNLNLPNKNSLGLDLDEGTPYWKITVTPIDLKCDFNNNRNLENNSKILENNEIEIISKNFQIENNNNNCQPTLTGPINNEIFEVKINENQEIDSIISFKVLKKKLKGNSFYKKPVIEEEKNIKLSKNEEEINLTKDFDFDKNNLGFGEYKYEILIKTNDDYCHKNSKTDEFSSDEFSSENKIRKMISDDLIKKSFLKDKEHFGKKIGVSINGKNLYFDNRPLIFSNITSNISVKQNGITKNENVEIRDIALISHKIKKLKNFEESQQLISNIENTFKNKKIYKNISSLNSQTKVNIAVPNLQDDEKILVYFDKSVISNISEIIVDKNKVEILDMDPLISFKGKSINYELPGNEDLGVLILLKMPIVFNSNNLI